MGEGPGAAAIALALSGALHAAVALGMPSTGPRPGQPSRRGPPVEVAFEVPAPQPLPEPAAQPPAAAPVEPRPESPEPEPQAAPSQRPRHASLEPSRASVRPRTAEPTSPEAEPDREPGGELPPDARSDEQADDTRQEPARPRSEGMYSSELAALERAAPPSGGGGDAPELPDVARLPSGGVAAEGPSDAEPTLDERLSGHLAREGNRRTHVSERPPPDLKRRADGSFAWAGPTVEATIEPDGSVRFDDVGATLEAEDARVGFDLTSALEQAAGNDPHYAERRWFLEQTRELRERLMRAHRERAGRSGARKVLARVRGIWNDEGRSPRARRAAIFAVWDGCSEDAMGRPARRAIERYVREHLPEGSDAAYSRRELRRLNADRHSQSRFTPY